MTMCELGCGPGLPSLTAAAAGVGKVIATDLEPLALELVSSAALDQNLVNVVETRLIDLCGDELPQADLYVLSDVFESGSVAKGAARLLHATNSPVWVFCQSDRAQREIFRNEMRALLGDNDLDWISMQNFDPSKRVCLFDVDESEVSYA
jgi:predicted nicotinamide N-methyase